MNDCTQSGHLWVEENGEPYARHRDRKPGKVDVMCCVCGLTAKLEAFGKNTAPPSPGSGVTP